MSEKSGIAHINDEVTFALFLRVFAWKEQDRAL